MLSLLFIVPTSKLAAQEQGAPITIGRQFVIKSRELNQDRTIWLYLPDSYDNSDQAYPVMYITDAGIHFFHFAGIVDFQAQVNRMPEMIIVAVTNIDRTYDLTPPGSAEETQTWGKNGGADKFINFFRNDLIPYIEENYRTQPFRIHAGWSFGGLFVGHSFITDPNLFDAYISISPTNWWNNNSTIIKTDELLSDFPLKNKFYYMTVGSETEQMIKGTQDMADVFAKYPDHGVEFTYKFMEKENHGSIPHRTLYDALELLYEDWEFETTSEFMEQPSLMAIDEHFANLSNRFGYKITTPEDLLNNIAYRIMGQGNHAVAIELFEANTERYPESANVYDGLGDGFTAAGDLRKALKNYKKAVKLGEETNSQYLEIFKANVERTKQAL
jgi:predicted alpha/beta superfamily hydrolase